MLLYCGLLSKDKTLNAFFAKQENAAFSGIFLLRITPYFDIDYDANRPKPLCERRTIKTDQYFHAHTRLMASVLRLPVIFLAGKLPVSKLPVST